MGVRPGAKLFVCGVEVGKKNLISLTDETSLTCRKEKSGRKKGDR